MPDVALFEAGVAAIDAGDVGALGTLLAEQPELVRDRWMGYSDDAYFADAYFADPYLLWFVANNPIREERMPPRIAAVARLLVDRVQAGAADTAQHQLDYALALVVSARVPREAGVQLELIDVLVDGGANPNALETALGHRETEAAEALLARGADLNLVAAACLDRPDDLACLARLATADDLHVALAGAAIYGNAAAIQSLLGHGAEPNSFCPAGLHPHSTPVHQAVFSGSLDAVRTLVDAGADLTVRDRSFDSTPLGWAVYGGLDEIAAYLRSVGAS